MKLATITFFLLTEIFFYISYAEATRSGPDLCPTIISKRDWGGNAALRVGYTSKPLERVVIHHTVTPECANEARCSSRMVSMQNYHMDELGYDDISYNFVIGGDGRVYEGVGWHKKGSHSPGWDSQSIGIAFIGDFTNKLPSREMLDAAKDLIVCAIELGELTRGYKLLGARNVKATKSPGDKLYREIQNWEGFTRRP
uniref:Peptidoglycan-recognition protein 1 n=1 Tax=Holotrichia diomphalia TaxID=33394 RepID=PGRP1_HOLDI|nr:RecName: Full=Peptidoglycan-recognition protein 1; AltName: Full=Hd-PGRP-1; Flags: Precursor [Holotrichia diomphalia]BAD08316.1 peptidoglycan recognition protein-1 [Holotrichia diomphalia]